MIINEKWTYKEIVENILPLRLEYEKICNNFDTNDPLQFNQRIAFRKAVKKTIYSFPFEEDTKDMIWRYLHREIGIGTLKNKKM